MESGRCKMDSYFFFCIISSMEHDNNVGFDVRLDVCREVTYLDLVVVLHPFFFLDLIYSLAYFTYQV